MHEKLNLICGCWPLMKCSVQQKVTINEHESVRIWCWGQQVLTYRSTILPICIHAVNYGSYRVLLYFCSLGSENVACLARNGYKIFVFVWGDPIMYRTSSYTHTHIAYTEAYWTHIGHEQSYTLYNGFLRWDCNLNSSKKKKHKNSFD